MLIAGVNGIMGRGILWGGVILAIAVLASLGPASRAGAQEPTVRLEVPSLDEQVGEAPFPVDVVVEDVADLGAFEFRLAYDESVLRYLEWAEGPFLGSSGRTVECLDPRLAPGSVHILCVTLGQEPPGPDGSGTLATVTFELLGPGTSPLRFEALTLAEPDAQRIQAVSEHGLIAFDPAGVVVTPVSIATPTPTAVAADATATEPAAAGDTPGPMTTPGSAENADDGGTNWALWGSVIGAAVFLMATAAGAAAWYRVRRLA